MLLSTFLVEDKSEVRNALFEAMEAVAPVRFVGHADTERDARLWLQQNDANWELVIVDLFLAEGTGFGVLKDCQSRKPNQKVVVLTNYCQQLIANKCIKLGADRVFDKNSDLDLLVAFCRSHAERLDEPGSARSLH